LVGNYSKLLDLTYPAQSGSF